METEVAPSRAEYVEKYDRFKGQIDAIDPEKLAAKKFLIIGAGAIGSAFVTYLAKMGARNITVMDDDTVENHNISNQMYPEYAVNSSKVDALADVCRIFAGLDITIQNIRFSVEAIFPSAKYDYIVSCVDSIEARKDIWAYAKDNCEWFIDGRMALEVFRAYCVNPKLKSHVEFYDESLTGEQEVARCTEKTIMYTVQMVSGTMLSFVKATINGASVPIEVCHSMCNFFGTTTYRD